MVCVITGDIINSRKVENPGIWLDPLKKLFGETGETPAKWAIYRGDSFQVEVRPEEVFLFAVRLKSVVKSVKLLDARMAIGIGKKSYEAHNVMESSGDAYLFSGETFEALDVKKSNIVVKSYWKDFDEEVNILLTLLSVIMDDWSTTSAKTADIILREADMTQQVLAKRLGISQSSVSARYNRAHLHEIKELLVYLKKRIVKQIRNI